MFERSAEAGPLARPETVTSAPTVHALCILRAEEEWSGGIVRLLTAPARPQHVVRFAPASDTLVFRITGTSGRVAWDDGSGQVSEEITRPGRASICPGGIRLMHERPGQGPCSLLTITYGASGRIERPNFDLDEPEIARLLTSVVTALQGSGAADRRTILHELFERVARSPVRTTPPRAVRGGLPPHAVRRVVALMNARLASPPGLAEMAALVGLSPAHFCTVFGRATGLSPHRMLRERQMVRACDLLTTTGLRLTEVALACGFGSASHFADCFRAESGMTPSAYRRALRAREAAQH